MPEHEFTDEEVIRKIFADVKKAIKEEAFRLCKEFEKTQDPIMEKYYKDKQDTAIFLYMKVDSLEMGYMEKEDEKETD